jgi:hypothetical protein
MSPICAIPDPRARARARKLCEATEEIFSIDAQGEIKPSWTKSRSIRARGRARARGRFEDRQSP